MVITTQVYNFGDGYGDKMFVSEGYEFMAVDATWARAITGGSGLFAGFEGELQQTFKGMNAIDGVVLGFEITHQGKPIVDEILP